MDRLPTCFIEKDVHIVLEVSCFNDWPVVEGTQLLKMGAQTEDCKGDRVSKPRFASTIVPYDFTLAFLFSKYVCKVCVGGLPPTLAITLELNCATQPPHPPSLPPTLAITLELGCATQPPHPPRNLTCLVVSGGGAGFESSL